jgi:hypothetical protein
MLILSHAPRTIAQRYVNVPCNPRLTSATENAEKHRQNDKVSSFA